MPMIDFKPQNDTEIMKETFTIDGIESKTELTITQIEAVTKIKSYGFIMGNAILSNFVGDFLILQKSKDRKSLTEFVDIMKGKREELMQKGQDFLRGMMG